LAKNRLFGDEKPVFRVCMVRQFHFCFYLRDFGFSADRLQVWTARLLAVSTDLYATRMVMGRWAKHKYLFRWVLPSPTSTSSNYGAY